MLPYIEVEQYNVRFRQMQDADLEAVRIGRNSPLVRKNHFHQEPISREEHAKWYAGVRNSRDYYFVIARNNSDVGLFYLKDIAFGMRQGHTGFFIWDESALHTRIPLLATLVFAEFFFFLAGLQNMEGIVHRNNLAMLRIAKFFNYYISGGHSGETIRILGTRGNYLRQRDRLVNFGQKLSRDPDSWKLKIRGNRDIRHQPEILRLIP